MALLFGALPLLRGDAAGVHVPPLALSSLLLRKSFAVVDAGVDGNKFLLILYLNSGPTIRLVAHQQAAKARRPSLLLRPPQHALVGPAPLVFVCNIAIPLLVLVGYHRRAKAKLRPVKQRPPLQKRRLSGALSGDRCPPCVAVSLAAAEG